MAHEKTKAGVPLFIPSWESIQKTNMYAYIKKIEHDYDVNYNNYFGKNYEKDEKTKRLRKYLPELPAYSNDILERYEKVHRWSIENPKLFWSSIWDICRIEDGDKGKTWLRPGSTMMDTVFFPDGYFNYAQQLMRFYNDEVIIRSWCENIHKFEITSRQLYDRVSVLAQALKDSGLKKGDRVCGILPNAPGAVIGMLATVSLGGVWSSASPDFGVFGLLDRFGQIEPKFILATDYYYYKGKKIDCIQKAIDVWGKMPSVKKLIFLPYDDTGKNAAPIPAPGISIADFTKSYASKKIDYVKTNFNDPVFILYSSGTTGPPKCIVHRVGLLLQLVKEHQLHCDVHPGDRLFYFSTCGWMMWNWQVTALASHAALCIYDGNPFYPKPTQLLDFVQETGATVFGMSVKYLQGLMNENVNAIKSHPMPRVRIMIITGSPLLPEYHEYIYDNIKNDVVASAQTGGTDLCSSMVSSNPIAPVWAGEMHATTLGMATKVFDENGVSVVGKKGEMVVNKPFPPQPICFYNDPNDEKYRKSYFSVFPGVWNQGDFSVYTNRDTWIVYGRSDAVLNPGGVRIGTAEIYRVAEDEEYVEECAAVGRKVAGDVDVVLFVVMKKGAKLTPSIVTKLKEVIRTKATPRHVPKEIYQVADLPHTKTGKLAELAIRSVVNNEPVKNTSALENPQSLENFYPYRTAATPKL